MTADNITASPAVWNLYRDGEEYSLIVFGPYPGPTWDVEVHEGHFTDMSSLILTRSLERDTHIVGDMFDSVTEALAVRAAEREDYELNPSDPPEWMRLRIRAGE
jgi:hypothetical protein